MVRPGHHRRLPGKLSPGDTAIHSHVNEDKLGLQYYSLWHGKAIVTLPDGDTASNEGHCEIPSMVKQAIQGETEPAWVPMHSQSSLCVWRTHVHAINGK